MQGKNVSTPRPMPATNTQNKPYTVKN